MNEQMKTDIKAVAAARRLLTRLAETYGARVNLRFKVDEDGMPLRVQAPGHEEDVVLGTEVYSREVDGLVHFDLYDQECDVTIESIRIVNTGAEAWHLLTAVHLQTPVPPIHDQIVRDGPDGSKELVVWEPDGTAKTFRMAGDAPQLWPNRRVFFGRPI
jgi:hypothetical protein